MEDQLFADEEARQQRADYARAHASVPRQHSSLQSGSWYGGYQRESLYSPETTDYVVEGEVNDMHTTACPDTGADDCVISDDFASKLGLLPISGTRKLVVLANGKTVESPGMVELHWKFSRDRTPHSLHCWILPDCINDLVLGRTFLGVTKTLTTFRDRIKRIIRPKTHRLKLIGTEKQRILGSFNNQATAALADTGSDLMLVSSKYVKRHGLTVNSGNGYCSEVELADGTTTYTTGVVRNATWRIGDDAMRCDFHVLDDLIVDVILSKDYIFERNIFAEHAESFIDIDLIDEASRLCGIRALEQGSFDMDTLEGNFLRDGM